MKVINMIILIYNITIRRIMILLIVMNTNMMLMTKVLLVYVGFSDSLPISLFLQSADKPLLPLHLIMITMMIKRTIGMAMVIKTTMRMVIMIKATMRMAMMRTTCSSNWSSWLWSSPLAPSIDFTWKEGNGLAVYS